MDKHTYPDSGESEEDVVYDGEGESEPHRINLRNEVMNQISVDACGEQCAQLDDFNWFLPTDEWYGKSDGPESEMDTSYSGNGVHITTSDSSSPEMDTMSQRLSGPPVVAQTRPKGGLSDSNVPAKAPAAECPDDGQYFSDGYKTGVRPPKYIGF